MTFDSLLGWSLLDAKPVIIYSKSLDEYLVAWHGFPMTYEMAFSIAANLYLHIKPSLETKEEIVQRLVPIYKTYFKENITQIRGEEYLGYPINYYKFVNTFVHENRDRNITINNRDVLRWFDTAPAAEIN